MAFSPEVDVRLLPTARESGAMNMALDEVAAETVAANGPASIRVYGWAPSTLSLGYAQDPETIDWDACDRDGIDVTRRPTGGGAIYHDAVGDIAYSIVAPRSVLPGDLMDCYDLLCEPIIEAFAGMGLSVHLATEGRAALYEPACYLRELHPSHDLVVPGDSGERKISGNAQHRVRDAVVQHGSLLFRSQAAHHLAYFTNPPTDPAAFDSRVTAIEEHRDLTRAEAIGTLERTLADWSDGTPGGWTDDERSRAAELVSEKYGNVGWVRNRGTG